MNVNWYEVTRDFKNKDSSKDSSRPSYDIVSVSEHKYLSFSSLIKAILEHRFVNKYRGLTEELFKQLRFWVSIEVRKTRGCIIEIIVLAPQSF